MIKGFFQTDAELIAPVRGSGCALLSSCYIAPQMFSQDDVNDLYKALLQVEFIDPACTILDWDKVLWSISPMMHFKQKADARYQIAANEREIIKWWLSNVRENHFTVGKPQPWDSMNRPDIMSKYATFVEKVIITIGG